jgi:hypothetical protein
MKLKKRRPKEIQRVRVLLVMSVSTVLSDLRKYSVCVCC